MGLPEESFYKSSIGKVVFLIEQWGKEQRAKAEALQGRPMPAAAPVPQSARRIKDILGGLV